MFVPFEYCPAPGDIQNVHLQKLLGEFQKLLLKYSEKSTSKTFHGSSPAEHYKDVDLLQSGTASWDSCLLSSFTHPVWLREFCYASSSASDNTTGGIPT